MFRHLPPLAIAAGLAACGPSPAPAPPDHTLADRPPLLRNVTAMPRLRGMADTAAQRRANAELARYDREIVQERRECDDQAHEKARVVGDTYPGIEFFRDARVTYDSPRYLSVEVHVGYDCNGTYPTHDSPRPLTLDLATGRPLDWDHAFVANAGVRDVDEGDLTTSPLGRLYLAQYHRLGLALADSCESALSTWNAPVVTVWLARDPRGRPALGVMPAVAHVVANCSTPLVLPAAEVRGLVADSALRAELGGDTRESAPPAGRRAVAAAGN